MFAAVGRVLSMGVIVLQNDYDFLDFFFLSVYRLKGKLKRLSLAMSGNSIAFSKHTVWIPLSDYFFFLLLLKKEEHSRNSEGGS